MDVNAALIESWDRNCRIVNAVAGLVTESNMEAKPSEDGWPLYKHLSHIHQVRRFHLQQLDPDRAAAIEAKPGPEVDNPTDLLKALRRELEESTVVVREVLLAALETGKCHGPGYDHPVFFLQHLIWHEGWHVGLIFLALRLAGQEVPEEWEEAKVWGEWRTD